MKQRFIDLSWSILEAKCIYYKLIHLEGISDEKYDTMEEEYKTLGHALGLRTTATDMVGWDESRPACIIVERKLRRGNDIKKR